MQEHLSNQPARRLGVVSFLNAQPLIQGLESTPDVEIVYDVPSRLPSLLDSSRVDAALVPVIDLLGGRARWKVVSDACIGCDGETMTVRIFSRVPPEEITQLHVDGDSHTSVALARVLWQEQYGRTLQITRFEPWSTDGCQAVLLIGDKVVTHQPSGFSHDIDLGDAWKRLTGLPFVFAVWVRPIAADVSDLGARLSEARDAGLTQLDSIAEQQGPARGWPIAAAKRYLADLLSFVLTTRHHRGLERFLELAAKWQVAPPAAETAKT